MALMIIALELGEDKRKVLVEKNHDGEETSWLVGYIPILDDTDRRSKLEFMMMGTILFREYEDAEECYKNYSLN